MTRFRVFAIVGALVGAMVLTFPALASPPTSGSGTGTVTSLSIASSRNAGNNVIQERDLEGTIDSGALSGTFTEHVRGVIHKDGLLTFEGTMTFTGSVEGCGSGMVTLGVSGFRAAGAPAAESTASIRVIQGAANTIGVHGLGTVYQDGLNLTYDVRYHC